MPQYLLLVYQDEALAPEWDSPDWDVAAAAHRAFQASVAEGESRLLGTAILHTSAMATTVRDGLATDGPFVETKEHLGGFYLLEAADLDEALRVARLVPAPLGGVEVRPLIPLPPL